MYLCYAEFYASRVYIMFHTIEYDTKRLLLSGRDYLKEFE